MSRPSAPVRLRRRLLAGLAALALLAAAAFLLAPSPPRALAEQPEPSASAELRVWQSVSDPLRLWISSRPGEGSAWRTTEVELAVILGGGWRSGGLTVPAREGELELRLWQDPAEPRTLHLSARPAGASWSEYGTQPLDLDKTGRGGRYTYADLTVALEAPDAAPAPPGGETPALCIPDDLDTEAIEGRVWRSVAEPGRYWVTTRADKKSRWTRQARTIGAADDDGWRTLGVTADAGDADFELRLWRGGDGAHHLSARVAGATWLEYGTRALDLDTTSRSGRYTYADTGITLTLPEAEPPLPGEEAASWECPEAAAGAGAGAGGVQQPGGSPPGGQQPGGSPPGGQQPGGQQPGGSPPGGSPPGQQPGQLEERTPVAEAGDDREADRGARILLNANGSQNHEGGVRWAKTSGTYTGAVSIPDPERTWFWLTIPTAATPGQTIILTLTVTSLNGQTDSDTLTITVTNQPPTADAGDDAHIPTGATTPVSLDGSGSTEPEGDTLSYLWALTDEGTYGDDTGETVTIADDDAETTSFTLPSTVPHGRTLIFKLTVTDEYGGESTDKVTYTVNTPPRFTTNPSATPTSAARGSRVTLNDGAASDADGGTLTYTWKHTRGTYKTRTGNTITPGRVSSSFFEMPTDAKVDETVVMTRSVTDDQGATATYDVTVTATNAAPTATATACIGTTTNPCVSVAQGVYRTLTVTLSGSGSDPEDEDSELTYRWALTDEGTYGDDPDETVTITDSDKSSASFVVPKAAAIDDTLIFALEVTDTDNATATAKVTITAKNHPPTVDAGPNINATVGIDTSATAIANDPDCNVTPPTPCLTYRWAPGEPDDPTDPQTPTFLLKSPTNQATLGLNIEANLHPSHMNQPWWVDVTVTDADSATATASMTVTVNNRPPTADAGADQTITGQGSTVNLSGSSNDPDNAGLSPGDTGYQTLSYSWALTDEGTYGDDTGETVTLLRENTATPSFDAPDINGQNATLIFKLTVSDGKGGTATDTVTVTVHNLDPQIVVSGTPSNVTTGNSYTLTATGNDPDGDNNELTYSWSVSQSPSTAPAASVSSGVVTIPANAAIGNIYTVTATVTDEDGDSASHSAALTVNNRPPGAAASVDYCKNAGQRVDAYGMSTRDPDNAGLYPSDTGYQTLTYSWAKTGGTYTGGITFTAGTTHQNTYYTMPSDVTSGQTIILTLTVSDPKDGVDTVSVTTTTGCTAPANRAPTARAGSDQTVTMDNPKITLDGSGSSDPDGDTLTYWWNWRHGNSGMPALYTFITSPSAFFYLTSSIPLNENVELKLTVQDGRGGSSADYVAIRRENAPPKAEVKTPDKSVRSGTATSFGLEVKASDADEQTLTYLWSAHHVDTNTAKPAGLSFCASTDSAYPCKTSSSATPTLYVEATAASGTYHVGVNVSDGTVEAISRMVLTVTVNTAPTVTVSPPSITHTASLIPVTYTLTATASDADGHSLTYTWTKSANFQAILTGNGSRATLEIRPGTALGAYSVKVKVTDGNGGEAEATVTVILQ